MTQLPDQPTIGSPRDEDLGPDIRPKRFWSPPSLSIESTIHTQSGKFYFYPVEQTIGASGPAS